MIDIHSHVIFDVDDGAANFDEAAAMLKAASDAGVKVIFATPHYRKDHTGLHKVNENYGILKAEAHKLGISLFKGFEVRIGNYAAQIPEDFSGLTLHGTPYILVELPFDKVPGHIMDTIYRLQQNGLIPILAHPERCEALAGNKKLYMEILNTGCLMQLDASSISGFHGWRAKHAAKKMLLKDHIHFISSDAHNVRGYSDLYVKAYARVVKWVGKDKADRLFGRNAGVILAGIKNEDFNNRLQRTIGAGVD